MAILRERRQQVVDDAPPPGQDFGLHGHAGHELQRAFLALRKMLHELDARVVQEPLAIVEKLGGVLRQASSPSSGSAA